VPIRSPAVALALAFWAVAAAAQQPALESEQDKTLYALGQAIGSNLEQFDLTAAELAVVNAGLSDAVLERPSRVDAEAYLPRIQALVQQRAAAAAATEKAASAPFLEQMAKERGAERTASGLIFIPVSAGTGASPSATDLVRVHYHGTLRDGTVFDSSVDRGEPITLSLDGVIPCWTEGVQKMKVGGKAKLVCPAEIAYGDQGQGPIPAGATLVFEVELIAVE
jgi:FKBP-type peptidyl-prolyl cis-trans isomerase